MRRSRVPRTLTVVFAVLGVAGCGGGGPADAGSSDNPEALAAFQAGDSLWTSPGRSGAQAEEAAALMARAVELDPDYALAHAALAQYDAWIHQNWGRTAERAARVKAAAERAVALAPDLPETQAAMATYYYRVAKDYEPALVHYKRAQELDPDNVAALRMTGYVARRAGRLDEAVDVLERAETVTATRSTAWEMGNTYKMLGRWADARASYERARELQPDHWQPPHELAWLDIDERGDLTALRAYLAEAEGGFIGNRYWLAMVDGDWAAAVAALEAEGADPFSGTYGLTPRSLMRGLAYRRMGDEARATAEFEAARQMMEGLVAENPEDPRGHMSLGLAMAALGMKDEAIEAGRHGVALMPPERDALIGPSSQWWLAEIYAAAGEDEMALDELESILAGPLPAGPGTLALDPWFDTLEDNPRFKELTGGG